MTRRHDARARERARRLFLSGMSAAEIASRLGRSRAAVYDWITDLPKPRVLGRARNETARAEAMRLRVEEQLSVSAIAERLGISRHTLTHWLAGTAVPKTSWSEDEIATVERLYAAGVEIAQITAHLPLRTAGAVTAKIYALGLVKGGAATRPARAPSRPAPTPSPPVVEERVASRPWYMRLAARVYLPPRADDRPAIAARPPDVGAMGGGYSMMGGRTARCR